MKAPKREQRSPEQKGNEDFSQPPNPGDPGPALPEPREPKDPTEDPRIPDQGEFPRGV